MVRLKFDEVQSDAFGCQASQYDGQPADYLIPEVEDVSILCEDGGVDQLDEGEGIEDEEFIHQLSPIKHQHRYKNKRKSHPEKG